MRKWRKGGEVLTLLCETETGETVRVYGCKDLCRQESVCEAYSHVSAHAQKKVKTSVQSVSQPM